MSSPAVKRADRAMLDTLQHETFDYFLRNASPHTGLIADRTEPGAPASIAAIGLGLSALCVAVARGWMARKAVASRTRATLQFFRDSVQSPAPDATGYRGFYYHFLDMTTGRRAQGCELSTIDTALLIAGVLTASAFFDGKSFDEVEIRELAEQLYRRVDWSWACEGAPTIGHGWTPEHGALQSRWNTGYSEALLLYVLALGSPTFPVAPEGYHAWTSTFERKTVFDIDYIYAGPLFIHQLPHCWIDFRGIRDDLGRTLGWDYFENSARATLVHQRYAIANPLGFAHYSKDQWGLTASNGPGPCVRDIDGVRRVFYGYVARGAPFGPDDGTIAPWAVVASLPFAPEIVCATLHHAIARLAPERRARPGFDASFNSTFSDDHRAQGWVSRWRLGLNEGPIVVMIENHRSQLVWNLFRSSPHIVAGLRRAGFRSGWLDDR